MTGHHAHAHGTALASFRSRLIATLCLAAIYMIAEAIGGVLTGSLALLADAAHMLSDVAALALTLFAIWMARRPPTQERSFGFYRTEILAALVNGATLLTISAFIFLEAIERWRTPREVSGGGMILLAVGGLVVNLVGLWLLSPGRNESLNLKGAWLHVLTDALGSVQVIVAGVLIWRFGWLWVDPVASVAIGLLVVYSSWQLVKESTAVLMEGVPAHIALEEVEQAIMDVPGVCSVHDLHVWTITSGLEALSAHVVSAERSNADVLAEIRCTLRARFGIDHQTIQLEPPGADGACVGACT